MPYAVNVEKYTHSPVLKPATTKLFAIYRQSGTFSLHCTSNFWKLSNKYVEGINEKLAWISTLVLVALVIIIQNGMMLRKQRKIQTRFRKILVIKMATLALPFSFLFI